MRTVYLDYNSTTPIDPLVIEEIAESMGEKLANPASQHRSGQRARRVLESEKERIVDLLGGNSGGVSPDRLVVTSGGTESNNLALKGAFEASKRRLGRNEIIISSVEHPSISRCADDLQNNKGVVVHRIGCDQQGSIDLNELENRISEQTAIVSSMFANHETGVLHPVQKIAQICSSRGVLFHCDASQAVGKIDVDFSVIGADMMTFSPHKFYGPRQIGGLLIKRLVELAPIHIGGEQQLGARPGTEDISLVAGTRKALEICGKRMDQNDGIRLLRDRLENQLTELVEGTKINGFEVNRLPNTSNLSFPGVDRQALLMSADTAGLEFSTGSACSSGSSEVSPVLSAMGLPMPRIESAIRISLGRGTTADDIDFAVDQLTRIAKRTGLNPR